MTPTTTLASTAESDAALNRMVLDGRILDAFDRFYADDVVMQENAATPVAGKQANREREVQFLASIEQFHGARLLGAAAGEDHSYAEWVLDVTLKGGIRLKLEQVAARRWRDGLIVNERFYYNPTSA
jgi:hypothetical protein